MKRSNLTGRAIVAEGIFLGRLIANLMLIEGRGVVARIVWC